MTREQLTKVFNDSAHPNTAPVWFAIGLALFILFAIFMLIVLPLIRAWRDRCRIAKEYSATLAHKQKLHEGERW